MKVAIVGGTFDEYGGKSSKIINIIANSISLHTFVESCTVWNGGEFKHIDWILNMELINYDVIFWMPNIPNDKPKMRNIKELYPKKILVSSKRNIGEYSFQYIINHALSLKSNLIIEFDKKDDQFIGRVFDPLGNVWCDFTNNFRELVDKTINRLAFLLKITRQKTIYDGPSIFEIPNQERFFTIIKSFAEIFHHLISPSESVTRFLGNSSFRCARGFPSFKNKDMIFVSKRNVDKRFIDRNSFVPVKFLNGDILYYGDNKPSVDTPIQVRLYQNFPNINYMIHSHVYVVNAPFTKTAIPCGGIEEIDEILNTHDYIDNDHIAINLIGHGNIVMSKDLDFFDEIKYISREIPESVKIG